MTAATTRSRISAPDPEALAPEGRAVFDAAIRTFGAPLGPRIPLLHSPDLAVELYREKKRGLRRASRAESGEN